MSTDTPHSMSSSATALADAERAAAAPFLVYERSPRWFPPVAGAWFGALIALGFGRVPDHTGLRLVLEFALIIIGAAWFGRERARRGVNSSLDPRTAPPELRATLWSYFAGATIILGVGLGTAALGHPGASAIFVFAAATIGLFVFDLAYERGAAAARERLG